MPQKEKNIRAKELGFPTRQLQQSVSWFSSLFRRSRLYLVNLGQREVMPEMNQEKAITAGFNGNTAVYAIIKDDAEKFASIPRYVYDAESVQEKNAKRMPTKFKALTSGRLIKGDLNKLLNRPNPYQGQAAFYKSVRAYYKVEGEAFIWLNRGDVEGKTEQQQDLMPVLEMYPLPVDMVTVVPDAENLWGVLGYILKVAGQDYPMRKNDVIHWKDINLSWDASSKTHLRGMTPFKPGAATLQQNTDATLGATRMYQNDGAKGVLYAEEKSGWTPVQESQVRSVVDRKVNNNDIKGAVATIAGAGKLGYLDLGGTSVDLQLLEGKKMTWQELCALIGNPYEMYNTETTFANKEQAQKNWVSNKIMPASKELDDELNRVLLKAFLLEDKALICCDFSELPEMQDNMKELAEWLAIAWWITPDEKRELMGYEAKGELFDEAWVPNTVTPISQLDDGFASMANDIGLSDYRAVAKVDPAKNGKKVEQPVS